MNAQALVVVGMLAGTLVAGGCAVDDGSTGADSSYATESGACQYSGEGNELYKAAVDLAKRYQQSPCEVLQTEVFEAAQAAIAVCPAVGSLIATSEWAGALRSVLGALEVDFQAGELAAPGGGLDEQAVASSLSRGQTFWSIGPGAYGPWRIVHTMQDGQYSVEQLVTDANDDIVLKVTETGTFEVISATGAFVVEFHANPGAETEPLGTMALDRYVWEQGRLSTFRMQPVDDFLDEMANGPNEETWMSKLYNANVSECDA